MNGRDIDIVLHRAEETPKVSWLQGIWNRFFLSVSPDPKSVHQSGYASPHAGAFGDMAKRKVHDICRGDRLGTLGFQNDGRSFLSEDRPYP
jgi:hypothetical protein